MEYFSYFSFIIFKMLFFIFWPMPEKLLDCPKKNYFARLWGAAAHTPMQINNRKQLGLRSQKTFVGR